MRNRESVVISGVAVTTPFGNTLDDLWRGVCSGPTPVTDYQSGTFSQIRSPVVALAPDAVVESEATHRGTLMATDLIARALYDAGYEEPPEGAGLGLGCLYGEVDFVENLAKGRPPPMLATISSQLGFSGPIANTPSGCASGNLSMVWAADRILSGDADCMVAGGVDAITSGVLGMFMLFGNIAEALPRPFDVDRDGFLLGEGGAMFVMESESHARARRARVWARIVGIGTGHDAAHPTRPHPEARGVQGAVRAALLEADLTPADIGYVNAHSPGTEANDPGEAAAYVAVFGEAGVPVGSTKGALGHAQGGANALELAVCGLALGHRSIPPTLNVEQVDSALRLDVVHGSPRSLESDFALSAATGMGGAAAVLILERGDWEA